MNTKKLMPQNNAAQQVGKHIIPIKHRLAMFLESLILKPTNGVAFWFYIIYPLSQ